MIQKWDANQYINHASFVAEYGAPVLALLKPLAGEHILDLGCGDGALTMDMVKAGASVHGVDSSDSMISKARARGLSAEVMSGEQLTFTEEYDAVFSNAALHWMTDPDAVLQGVHKALKPEGRFVAEFGGKGNVQTIISAMDEVYSEHPEFGQLHNPWYFPDVIEYEQKLVAHGFVVHYIELIPRLTALDSGMEAWLTLFANGMTKNLQDSQKQVFLTEVTKRLEPTLLINEQWQADYVRLRFYAHKSSKR